MCSLVGWQEDEVDHHTGRSVCTQQAEEASRGSSACCTRHLKTRPAPPGLAGPGWQGDGRVATPGESVAQPESANAAPHP